MIKPRILIVEDEADIRRFVRMALEKEGMNVFETTTAEEARLNSGSRKPDLMIVDLGLPDGDGKTLIREVRNWISAPILVLSAREQETEKVEALDAGADDYLTKPLAYPSCSRASRAQLRRASTVSQGPTASPVVKFGQVTINLATHEVARAGEPVHLTPNEFRLLTALIRGHGKVLTHRQLLMEVWGRATPSVHTISASTWPSFGKKLEDEPSQPVHLITELQVGYRLSGLEVQEAAVSGDQ